MSSAHLIRSARWTQGLSQRALAERSGVAQPRIADIESGAHDATVSRLEALLSALGQRVTLLPTTARPAWEAGLDIADALAAGDEPRAWREAIQLSDDLGAADGALRVALCVTPPARTGHTGYDALIAGLVDHWLTSDRLPRPEWVREPARTVRPAWDVEPLPALREAARATTPPGLARHGVYLAASELVSV